MGLQYMPTLTPLKPPQLIGIYGGPMERLGKKTPMWKIGGTAPSGHCGR